MESQAKSVNNNKIELIVPYSLDACAMRLEKGYSVPFLDRNIRRVNEFRTLRLNKIDNNRSEFRAVYHVRKGKRARRAFISGMLQQDTAQSTQVTAQVEFPIRSMGCMAVFFSPLIVLGVLSEALFLVISIYVIMLAIGYVVLLNEYRLTAPASLEALSKVLEGKSYGPRSK